VPKESVEDDALNVESPLANANGVSVSLNQFAERNLPENLEVRWQFVSVSPDLPISCPSASILEYAERLRKVRKAGAAYLNFVFAAPPAD
jgi:hypothetical protein